MNVRLFLGRVIRSLEELNPVRKRLRENVPSALKTKQEKPRRRYFNHVSALPLPEYTVQEEPEVAIECKKCGARMSVPSELEQSGLGPTWRCGVCGTELTWHGDCPLCTVREECQRLREQNETFRENEAKLLIMIVDAKEKAGVTTKRGSTPQSSMDVLVDAVLNGKRAGERLDIAVQWLMTETKLGPEKVKEKIEWIHQFVEREMAAKDDL